MAKKFGVKVAENSDENKKNFKDSFENPNLSQISTINLQNIEKSKIFPDLSSGLHEINISYTPQQKNYKKTEEPIVSYPKSNFFEGVFPFPNKSYTESEKLSHPIESFNESKIPKGSMVLPSHIKNIETRLDIVEKIIGSTESLSIYHRLERFESILRFNEQVLDSLEPEIKKNENFLNKMSKKMKEIEKEMMGKLNYEQFDSIKKLIIALASGVSKNEIPTVEFKTKDINQIENIDKRLAYIENNYADTSKLNTISIDEIMFKLHRVEQKLDFKAESCETDKIRTLVTQALEQNKFLSSEIDNKEKKFNLSAMKPTDSSLIASINRKFLTFEETIKSFKLPPGVHVSTI